MATANEPNLDAIIGQIEQLPHDKREELFAWMISRLGDEPGLVPGLSRNDPDFEKEIDRRIGEMERGTVSSHSLEEVKGYVDERLRDSRS